MPNYKIMKVHLIVINYGNYSYWIMIILLICDTWFVICVIVINYDNYSYWIMIILLIMSNYHNLS